MAFKVNYGLERAERNRLKDAKKAAKKEKKAQAGADEVSDHEVSDIASPAADQSPDIEGPNAESE